MRIGRDRWVWLGPLCVVLGAALWGTETYFRVNLNTRFDSEVLVFHEHLFCIAFTLPLALTGLRHVRGVPRSSWIWLLLSGSVGSALGTTFFTMSLRELNPSVANVLLNFQPIVSVAFATLLLQERLGERFFLWATAALGCGLVIASRDFSFTEWRWNLGLVYVTVTALAWGFSTVAGRGAMLHLPLRVATLGRFVIGALTLLVSLALKGKLQGAQMNWGELRTPFVVENYIWLSLVAGVIPLFFYFKGLSKTAASVGGFCELTQTFSALLLTWGIMHNPLSLRQVLAGVGLLVAVYQINVSSARANEATRTRRAARDGTTERESPR
jgi:drug/metabolite transporter (DMT)-like permease